MRQNQAEFSLDLLKQHLAWYPFMEPRDVYKLFYQGVLGSEHLISSPQGFFDYLSKEFEPLQPDPTGRLLEPIRHDHSLFRINLRPYKALDQPVDLLVPALLETARAFSGNLGEFRAAWINFVLACENGQVPRFDVAEINRFTAWVEGLGFPAVHNSKAYRLEYQPAYRLISAHLAAQAGLGEVGRA
jgi:hypothetical protein